MWERWLGDIVLFGNVALWLTILSAVTIKSIATRVASLWRKL